MKTIEELGISPAPWTNIIETKKPFEVNSVLDNRNGGILTGGYTESLSDARLIAAAPDLYKCLYDAIITICRMCPHCSVRQSYECKEPKRKCCANVWRKVLADAAEGKARNE